MAYVMAAVAVISALTSANAQSKQMTAQKNAARYNQLVGEQQSTASLQAANAREEQQRRIARFASGERQAAIAQSGTGLGGSNADVDRQSEIMAELDALNIRYEGATQSTGLLNQSKLDGFQAQAYGRAAKNAKTEGYIGAATAAIGGVSKGYNSKSSGWSLASLNG